MGHAEDGVSISWHIDESLLTALNHRRWSQHGPLLLQSGPPYVYPYRAGNYTDLIRQMKRVIENPIER